MEYMQNLLFFEKLIELHGVHGVHGVRAHGAKGRALGAWGEKELRFEENKFR